LMQEEDTVALFEPELVVVNDDVCRRSHNMLFRSCRCS
jgi:hypothetical protein